MAWTLEATRAALIHWGLASRYGAGAVSGGNPNGWMSQSAKVTPLYDWTDIDSLVDEALAMLARRGNGFYVRVLHLAYRSDLPREAQAKAFHMRYVWYRELVWQGERFVLDAIVILDNGKVEMVKTG